MRWCARCQRRLYDQSAAFCPFDGTRLEVPASEESSADPYLGSTLGQFHLLAAIGSGSMGNVYRAWQAGMERTVAIKLLRADLLDDGELRRRFLREGRAAARLSHPNIVSVFMVGETDDGVPYLVMEHLSGETLDRVLDDGVRLPPARAAAIARQVASALAEAHAAGIVHRDLKPGNVVLLSRRGAGELVKLFDFGIAKIADRLLVGGDVGRITRDGEIFGTPNYIAPEQAQGGALDGRADLYSLGILLYRMLAGKLPFEGNAVAVMLAHISREPPHLAEVAPDVDPALVDLVMRCLAKDPDRRFASAEAFIGALDRAVTAGPLGRARTPLATPQAVEAVGRVSAPLAAVSRDQADASETGLWASPRPSVAPERSPRARRGALRASLAGLGVVILCSGAGTGAAALFRDGGVAAAGEPGSGSAPARVDRPDAGEHSADQAALRSILVGDRGYAVRALLPEPVRAGAPVELLFDVWQPDGAPLDVPAIPVALNTLGSPGPGELASGPDTALAARPVPGLPGRYRLVERLPAGEAALLLELAGGSIHVHFEVAPAGDLTR